MDLYRDRHRDRGLEQDDRIAPGNKERLPQGGEALGAVLAAVAAVGGAAGNLLTRHLMRDRPLRAGDVSMISMGIGSTLLLLASRFVEPFPDLTASTVILLFWLSLINTALAFTLWNVALRTLTALEGGVIANAQIIEVALMAWLVLGEQLAGVRIAAALVILLGVTLVQWRRPAVAVEAGSLYWHFVDFIWLVVFITVFIVR